MIDQQNHPLYQIDRDNLNRLLAKDKPLQEDLIDLARLFIRYQDFPGADDLKSDMSKTLRAWGLERDTLNAKTQKIWTDGYKPGLSGGEDVGSGFDTSDNTNK